MISIPSGLPKSQLWMRTMDSEPALRLRFAQFGANQFGKVLHGNRAVLQDGFMIPSQGEFVPQLALDLLPQAVMGHPAHKIGRKLTGTLLRPDDFQARFTFGLEG